jgi:hypothetical protein
MPAFSHDDGRASRPAVAVVLALYFVASIR